jgi:uncharacterized protein involved in exopolysaccharide biosynthesis
MINGPMGDDAVRVSPPSDLSERLVDGFFRRWVFYVLPVALFASLGVYMAGNITADYASYATLSAASNPNLSQPTIRGTEISPFESPANGTARLINEQLQTDAFIDAVAMRAGLDLTEAENAGSFTRVDLRNQISARGLGQNTLQLTARWTDPDTAYRLVDGLIAGYVAYLTDIAAADSLEAVDFWTEQVVVAADEARAAEAALSTYLARFPADPETQSRSTEQGLAIERLNAALDRALEAESDAQDRVDEAQLTANQAASNATREFTVIDAPEVATAPEPVRRDQITAIAMFTLLGLLIGFVALVLSTVADRALRTRSQLVHAARSDSVVTIPRIKDLRRQKRRTSAPSDKAA